MQGARKCPIRAKNALFACTPNINNMKRELKLHAECFQWFHNNYCLKHHNPRCMMFVVPNEIVMTVRGALMASRIPTATIDKISAIIHTRLRATGLVQGVSDTVVVLPNKVLFVEFKTSTGYQSEKQKEFQAAVESCNHQYHIVRSLEEFQSIIRENAN